VSRRPTLVKPVAAGSLMRKRHTNHRLVKSHRSYKVEEIARLLAVHKNTVREWIKAGLPSIDDRRPILILGSDLIAFLRARRASKKRPCGLGQMFCFRCRATKFPAGDTAEYIAITEKIGNLTAICPDCTCMMHRVVSRAKLADFLGKTDITFPQALRRLSEISQPSVNSDLRGEAQR
jgi:excisionase family DNA binding protein